MTHSRPTAGAPSTLVEAYRGRRPARLPIWFMRQAGRSLPEYRAARAGIEMLTACTTPELVAEITAQPVRRHGVDAGIFYSDIVVPLYLAGVDVTIQPGVGPVFGDPVGDDAALDRLLAHDPADLTVITEATRLATAAIPVPLIGFAGAPFTLAAYAVEGRSSRDHLAARTLMHAQPASWDRLMNWMADQSGAFLAAQVAGGAQAVQLFDSWAGSLSAADYRRFVLPYSARALSWVRGQVPVVHFGTGTGEFLNALREA
ncbi:MAG: uroporphyrinogen decarboxylase family protein, partial [Brooklawnia sp.]|uniref:uroporphyrinogen decarboxylase family protein n=1 Tax=Brooklawnia sp. TaxID=2699740 RepID=UPI003C773CA3